MEILATEQFVEQAREAPGPLKQVVKALEDGPERERAVQLTGDRAVGFARSDSQLRLFWYVDSDQASKPNTPAPLFSVRRAELKALGVPKPLIPRLQRAKNLEEIAALGLPEATLDKIRFQFFQLASGGSDDEEALVRRADSAEQLLDFLNGRLIDLLLNLDKPQRRVVELAGTGTILVRGVAGSGKTSVGLHRVRHQLAQGSLLGDKTALVLTFNRSLARACREMLVHLGGPPMRRVAVQTVHKWCIAFLNLHGGRVMKDTERRRRLREAVEAVRVESQSTSALWSYPQPFWRDEIHLIKGRVLQGEQEYLQMRRYGTGRPLSKPLRQQVWRVYEVYRERCRRAQRLDWDDVIRETYDRMLARGESAPKYDFVFLDEAQDLTVVAVRLVALLARRPGELMVSYDPAQSIYERGFRWKAAGITVRGARSFAFTHNYRNTRQILGAARPVLAAVRSAQGEEDDDDQELLEPDRAVRVGAPPQHLRAEPLKESRVIAVQARELVERRRVPAANIAVLAYPNKVKDAIVRDLRRRGLRCQTHDGETEIQLRDPSIKVLPIKSAKGLEFPVVFLVASERLFRPPRDMEEPEQQAWEGEVRRLFYVGMTRAMSEIYLVYDHPPAFLSPYVAQGTRIFHRAGCSALAPSGAVSLFDTRTQATNMGLRPCTRCRP